ncbi:MAG: glycosyltransferase family 39 protein [Eggerthellaceae bacterium]|nr:glycosyltransferase family 39 protein [Eggerthellaceae bacterium]
MAKESTALKPEGGIAGFARAVPAFLQSVYAIYLALAFIAALCIAPFVEYACKPSLTDYNALFAIVGIAIGLAICAIVSRTIVKQRTRQSSPRNHFGLIIVIGSICLLAIQIIIFLGCRFETGWDVMRLVQMSNDAQTMYAETLPEYYSIYPNQLFLGGLFRRIGTIASFLGVSDVYAALTICSLVCVNVSIAFAAFTAEKLAGKAAGYFTFAIAALLIGINPWILVPYSDTFAMPATTLQFWAYFCIKKKQVRWPIIAICAYIGYCIKPTAIFALAAICIVAFCRFLRRKQLDKTESSHSAKETIGAIIATCLACAIAFAFTIYVKDFGIEVDQNRSFGIPHYLMMGANGETNGIFSSDDVGISLSASTAEERSKMNIAEWKKRIAENGFLGCGILAARKTLTNYTDGTFAFGIEGAFFQSVQGDNETLKWFFGIDSSDPPYAVIAQILWFLVLFGTIWGSIPRKTANHKAAAIAIALLFLSVFLMVFECRARYLYLFAPSFVVLSSAGWLYLANLIAKRRTSKR